MAALLISLCALTAASAVEAPCADNGSCSAAPSRTSSLMQLNAVKDTKAPSQVSLSTRKPLHIAWGGSSGGGSSGKDVDGSTDAVVVNDTGRIERDSAGLISKLTCGQTLKVNETFSIDAVCPSECPLHALNTLEQDFCMSVCVTADHCAKYNPAAPIADFELGTCREASVDGCDKLNYDGTDTCLQCNSFRYLTPDGKCNFHEWAVYSAVVVLVLVAALVITYAIDLNMRPVTNPDGLKDALAFRSAAKYRMPNFDGAGRKLYPMMTNLCTTLVGGPGLALHFRSQAVMIVWAFLVALGWLILAYAVDTDLLILGTRPYGHEFKNCVLVAWGHATQQRLMWTKALFVTVLYAFTVIGCLVFGVMQLRYFQRIDYDHDTMKDYAARVSGLPQVLGNEHVEEELKVCIAQASGMPVVGVSICWDFGEHEEQITLEMMKSVEEQAAGPLMPSSSGTQSAEPGQEMGVVRSAFIELETAILEAGEDEGLSESATKQLLDSIATSSEAFVVFETEESRDLAVLALSGGVTFRGTTITLAEADVEPHGVYWGNFNTTGFNQKVIRLCKGLVAILLGFIGWSCLFYAPYAWAILTFNYAGGRMPGTIYSLAFSLVVAIGNATMAEICARISDYMGFQYKDSREKCYMILYMLAVSLNIVLDLWTTYVMAYSIMVGLNFRTFDGRLLPQVEWFMDRFETYAMQRSLGQNLYEYAMPSTFILPFLAEPVGIIYLLMRVFILIVRSHPKMKRWTSRGWLAAADLELGRYADCLVNVYVAVMAFYFPGGYIFPMFLALALSHVYIYGLDQFRILRVVPRATFSSMDVDWWFQAMFAPICGLLLSCILFKANCQTFSGYCLEPGLLLPACIGVFVAHCVVHLLLLLYVVPLFGRVNREGYRSSARTYKEVASADPCSWFSVNPVHCLRSKFVYRHSPPCSYFIAGQDHTMKVNESIGCYFAEEETTVEDASSYELSKDSLKELYQGMGMTSGAAQEEPAQEPETEKSAD
eukprot:gb/GFBE01064865.1/.p1 GENE.gb/GFBE01064865.1/~~gb/GFBE01064865.1/.p1  ORF type:complete len:998 (+),score=224.20 gb/GFBE01064865.1/:1-2994(+)